VEVEPETYRPVLRGMLLTGRRPQYLSRARGEEGRASDEAPWWPPHKIAGRHLAPYLAAHPELREAPVGHV
jgi:sulfide:quinone oxidoreductase